MSLVQSIQRRGRSWARRHSYSFFSSLGALLEHRLGTLMTVLVLGIAMVLPLGLYLLLMNLGQLDVEEERWGAMTVFLEAGTTEQSVQELLDTISDLDSVHEVSSQSPEQGLAEFRDASGFGSSLELLESNPLPWVLTVVPESGEGLDQRVARLSDEMGALSGVVSVEFDQKWLERLGRILELGRAIVLILSSLFAVAVIVVVANTIRLDVAARSDEIEILSLVGAWPGFIRQPFLYSGFWYGLMGGVVAMVLINLGLEYLDGPLSRLLQSYGEQRVLLGLGVIQTLGLLIMGGLLGLLGAAIAVQRHLRLLRIGGRPLDL